MSVEEETKLNARIRELEHQIEYRDLMRQLLKIEDMLGLLLARPESVRRGRPPGQIKSPVKCTVEDCQDPARAKTLCQKHYQSHRRAEKAIQLLLPASGNGIAP